MLRNLVRFFTFFLMLMVLLARFGIPEILASEISNIYLVEQANKERLAQGLTPLKYNKKLERAAFLKAENMLKEQYWSHYGPHKESPWQFILQTGYSYQVAGENLAKGFSEAQSVHDAWMASPTHRANIMDSRYQDIGIAVVKGDLLGNNVYLVVQMFGNVNASVTGSPADYPRLQITSPEDGDILEDGIIDIRGEADKIESSGVSVYIDKTMLGTTQPVEKKFSLEANLSGSQGEQTITAKAVGIGDTYLADNVVVTVIKNASTDVATKNCITGKINAVDFELRYSCSTKPQSFTATIEAVKYTADSAQNLIKIPVSALPENDAQIIVSLQFPNQANTATSFLLSDFGVVASQQQTVAGSGQNIFSSLTLKQGITVIFVIAAILLLLYIAQLIYKKQLFEHRAEVLIIAIFLVILFIVFNVGIVRL